MTHHTTTWRTGMSVRSMARTAIFTALLAVMSQIAIPLPMVPINLGLLAVYLAALLLTRSTAVRDPVPLMSQPPSRHARVSRTPALKSTARSLTPSKPSLPSTPWSRSVPLSIRTCATNCM